MESSLPKAGNIQAGLRMMKCPLIDELVVHSMGSELILWNAVMRCKLRDIGFWLTTALDEHELREYKVGRESRRYIRLRIKLGEDFRRDCPLLVRP